MKFNLCYLGTACLFFIFSCYQNQEGCLDTFAANFEVSADISCSKCCVYPGLLLNISQMAGDSIFRSDSTLINDIGQKYKILDVRFYVSSFELFQKEQTIKINEYISTQDLSTYLPDDMKIFRSVDKNITVGTIKSAGTFDSLTFLIGLSDIILNTPFSNLPPTHVLDTLNTLSNNRKLSLLKAKVTRLKSNEFMKDSTFFISVLASGQSRKINIGAALITKKGENLNYTIKADYFKLFQNLDLMQPIEVIETKLKQNISNGFIVY